MFFFQTNLENTDYKFQMSNISLFYLQKQLILIHISYFCEIWGKKR